MDSQRHRLLTGMGNQKILENCQRIYDLGIPLTLRVPCVPGINLTEENLRATAQFVTRTMPEADLELLAYHELGTAKYRALGLGEAQEFSVPNKAEMDWAADFLQKRNVRIGEYR